MQHKSSTVNKKGENGVEMLHYSSLDAIPITVVVLLTCIMSYWHGKSRHGWRIAGLLYTIILGIIAQILVGFFPMFG